jgi:hypothetical protein
MESVMRFLTEKLKLKVNSQKGAVARPWERKFLGFSFTANREPKRRIAPKSGEPIQREGAGTDVPDARGEHRTNGRRTDPVLTGVGSAISGSVKRPRCWSALNSGSDTGLGL